MGREVKRVQPDFSWPLHETWKGFLDPTGEYEDSWEPEDPPTGEGWQMWETTSEGSPISPVFSTPEELAKWLSDTGASSFGRMTATYDEWLGMIKVGWAPSAVLHDGVLESGVSAVMPSKTRED